MSNILSQVSGKKTRTKYKKPSITSLKAPKTSIFVAYIRMLNMKMKMKPRLVLKLLFKNPSTPNSEHK